MLICMVVVDSVAEPMPAPPEDPPVAVTVDPPCIFIVQLPSDRQETPMPALRPLPSATTVEPFAMEIAMLGTAY